MSPLLTAALLTLTALLATGTLRAQPSPSPATAPAPVAPATLRALAPRIVASPIPFGPTRVAQTEAYSARHYGEPTAELRPRAIVLHYTCGPSYRSAWHTFANNRAHRGEPPGVCAHYIIDFDGTIHELVAPTRRCRHAHGLNHVAIGIEFVQPCLRAGSVAVHQTLLGRAPQIEAGLRLVRWLRARFEIPYEHIVGHATANQSPLFVELLGRRNTHGDWRGWAVRAFLERLRVLERTERMPRRRSARRADAPTSP